MGGGLRHTEHGGHDADAGVFARPIGSPDAEFGEGWEAGRGELRAGGFGGHGCEVLSLRHLRVGLWRRRLCSDSKWFCRCRRVGIICRQAPSGVVGLRNVYFSVSQRLFVGPFVFYSYGR